MNKEDFLGYIEDAYLNAEDIVAKKLLRDEEPLITSKFEFVAKSIINENKSNTHSALDKLMADCILELLKRDLGYSNSVSIEHIKKITEKGKAIIEAKNHDYANSSDPFANFRLVDNLEICTVEIGILVRMSDKVARIKNLSNKDNAVKDETIEDTLLDLCNYSAILQAWMVRG